MDTFNMESTLWKRLTATTSGVTGTLNYNPVIWCVIAACSALAWAYTLELDLLIFYTFRRRTGLYFWSLLISSWGCSLHALGFMLKFMVNTKPSIFLPFIEIGWVAMVTGQAFVLFSRLHLVVRSRRTLRLVLLVICVDALALHIPTIIFTVGSNLPGNPHFWAPKYDVMERIQMTLFCVQEFGISTIYIVATVRLLGSIYHSMTRKVMIQLIVINCICIGMDIILISLEFTNNYVGETAAKPLIYAIKLRIEFVVLNQLMGLTKAGFTEENHFQGNTTVGRDGRSFDLQNGKVPTHASSRDETTEKGAVPQKKNALWSSTWGIHGTSVEKKDGANGNDGMHDLTAGDQIITTKQVDVTSQPKSVSDHTSSGEESSEDITPPVPFIPDSPTLMTPVGIAEVMPPGPFGPDPRALPESLRNHPRKMSSMQARD